MMRLISLLPSSFKQPFRPNLTYTSILILFLLQLTSFSVADISFCKCMCFNNYTIVPLYRPKDVSKPCLTCTKQFCLDQKLSICQDAKLGNTNLDTGTGDEGDIRTKCFQRDSTKDQVIVVSFIILTTVLLISALIKEHGEYWLQGYQALRNRNRSNRNF
ncbi:hypothetical protein PGT21_018409 [Puccinia graminis f. sp. tritici]|uniref:Transmembrane protein n=1 Tax=Puccinia graminis f. sp. tritici TaxID=56615 RepID=A0A5B0P5V0_PUCGR|nr:hypothetical protein PGT21_018409 [Puccinia graminis f. sp. tritici]KAA1131944.1 hypothetical protein PGTUg99_034286 [Puccinia graminis f. sp. tritici]